MTQCALPYFSRATKTTNSQDGRLVQLGDNGKLLVQGTEVEVTGVQPRKRAAREVINCVKYTTVQSSA